MINRSIWIKLALILMIATSFIGARYLGEQPDPANSPQLAPMNYFVGYIHEIGLVRLHLTNWGIIGLGGYHDYYPEYPSLEYPAGSGVNYLYTSGLWVGAITPSGDTLVSTAQYDEEFNPDSTNDTSYLVYRPGTNFTAMTLAEPNLPNSKRNFDDDGDWVAANDDVGSDGLSDDKEPDFDLVNNPDPNKDNFDVVSNPLGTELDGQPTLGEPHVDEDPLDGQDNDGDGLLDEDFAAIGQENYLCAYNDMTDRLQAHTPLNINVIQETHASGYSHVDDFIGFDFYITNLNDYPLENVYIGLFSDGDIGKTFDDDITEFLDTTVITGIVNPETTRLEIGYMYDADFDGGATPGYFGIMFLDHNTDPTGKTAPVSTNEAGYRWWSIEGGDTSRIDTVEVDPINDIERYEKMSAKTRWTTSPYPFDWRFLMTVGPFTIDKNKGSYNYTMGERSDVVKLSMVIVMGRSKDHLIENAIQAKKTYEGGLYLKAPTKWLTVVAPPSPPWIEGYPKAEDRKVTLKWNDESESYADPITEIQDFEGYRVYRAEGRGKQEGEVPDRDNWMLLADYDKIDGIGFDTGLQHEFVDTNVWNGFPYWYSVLCYDTGDTTMGIPALYGSISENDTMVMPMSPPGASVAGVKAVPNPFKIRAEWDRDISDDFPYGKRIYFTNLPPESKIMIYTLSGTHVVTLQNANNEPEIWWDLRSRFGQEIVSGIYYYVVESGDDTKVEKLVIIQ
jgi:hypothetical protein